MKNKNHISSGFPLFKVAGRESLVPDEKKAGDIFSRLGYKISDAIADLVDNSVDANASNVLIRFIRSATGVHSVIIADDGEGMNDASLKEAMRFGSNVSKTSSQLGKYGIGLKSASLSQAEVVTVLSQTASGFVGRRWTLENIKEQWTCEVLAKQGIQDAFKMNCGELKISRSGTIIIWQRLEHLQTLPQNIDRVLENTINELSVELGIRFHRFIEKKKLKIYIDQEFIGEGSPEVQRTVSSLNPFSYEISGRLDYPISLKLNIEDTKVVVKCHIWPPKSKSPGYRLGGGKVALRQGFYFYRNDRIIQAGGWNRLKADDGEPHLSLARVEINLPSTLDSLFKLDVTKSHLDPSPQFIQALQNADYKGLRFSDYLAHAELVYRQQKKKDGAKYPCIPGSGLSIRARKAISQILSEPGVGGQKKVNFSWSKLDHDEMINIDQKKNVIMINSLYKKYLLEGGKNDSPVLKILLMFLLQNELSRTIRTKKSDEYLQKLNQTLIAALK